MANSRPEGVQDSFGRRRSLDSLQQIELHVKQQINNSKNGNIEKTVNPDRSALQKASNKDSSPPKRLLPSIPDSQKPKRLLPQPQRRSLVVPSDDTGGSSSSSPSRRGSLFEGDDLRKKFALILLKQEEVYLKDLNLLLKHYQGNLKLRGYLPHHVIRAIIPPDLEIFHTRQEAFVDEFRMSLDLWSKLSLLGPFYQSLWLDTLDLHDMIWFVTQYATSVISSIRQLKEWTLRSRRFCDFLRESCYSVLDGDRGVIDLLLSPLTHYLWTIYLLKEVISNTEEVSPDHVALSQAVSALEEHAPSIQTKLWAIVKEFSAKGCFSSALDGVKMVTITSSSLPQRSRPSSLVLSSSPPPLPTHQIEPPPTLVENPSFLAGPSSKNEPYDAIGHAVTRSSRHRPDRLGSIESLESYTAPNKQANRLSIQSSEMSGNFASQSSLEDDLRSCAPQPVSPTVFSKSRSESSSRRPSSVGLPLPEDQTLRSFSTRSGSTNSLPDADREVRPKSQNTMDGRDLAFPQELTGTKGKVKILSHGGNEPLLSFDGVLNVNKNISESENLRIMSSPSSESFSPSPPPLYETSFDSTPDKVSAPVHGVKNGSNSNDKKSSNSTVSSVSQYNLSSNSPPPGWDANPLLLLKEGPGHILSERASSQGSLDTSKTSKDQDSPKQVNALHASEIDPSSLPFLMQNIPQSTRRLSHIKTPPSQESSPTSKPTRRLSAKDISKPLSFSHVVHLNEASTSAYQNSNLLHAPSESTSSSNPVLPRELKRRISFPLLNPKEKHSTSKEQLSPRKSKNDMLISLPLDFTHVVHLSSEVAQKFDFLRDNPNNPSSLGQTLSFSSPGDRLDVGSSKHEQEAKDSKSEEDRTIPL